MPEQNNLVSSIQVIKDVPQQTIIQKRREQREQLLKRIGQLTSTSEQSIERLYELTR
ncbi:hypothetical protein I8J29_16365 [Paenibacillus sp. MWE-103]|uniref:Uncharacterized protein n=1 Tax=Paenibacillus artemisiicola TaxID=1172618 RepID=A0ABS3WBY4_9BACL|nr:MULTISPECIES: hypothetical protein [Paenibacillus]MBO7745783.1 hypothetical protein [Paenibacillus artemisiicola]SFJ77436.1 hypothetical protein SAMN02799624_05928 [Paenibacillus sp. UNC496MF]